MYIYIFFKFIYIYIYDSQIVHHGPFSNFIYTSYNNSFDSQGSEIIKNNIF